MNIDDRVESTNAGGDERRVLGVIFCAGWGVESPFTTLRRSAASRAASSAEAESVDPRIEAGGSSIREPARSANAAAEIDVGCRAEFSGFPASARRREPR
jgi:hypothetical protein